MEVWWAVVVVWAASDVAWGGVPCGDLTCHTSQYCSENAFCESCEDVCQLSSHNYDDLVCKTKCGEYTHSLLYVSREELDAVVSRVYVYVMVSLAVSVLVLLLVLGTFLTIWLKYQRMRYCDKGTLKKKKLETISAICVNEVDNSKKLKLEMPVAPPSVKDIPPSAMTTMTPLSTRHPSEDATLEYAYDNPTLTPSPIIGKNQPAPVPATTPNTTPKTTRTETSF